MLTFVNIVPFSFILFVIADFKSGIIQSERDKIMSKVLLLNNDCEPLNITSWKRAFVLLIKGKAEYIEKLNSVEDYIKVDEYYIPKTIKLTYETAIPDLELPFSRHNIFIRDEFTCQYCGKKFPSEELTLDHVYPKSRGGGTSWENIVSACKKCNQKKADKTPEEADMPLLNKPEKPEFWIFELSKKNKIEGKYWEDYYKSAS